jgi:hypothetical protein
MRLFFFFFFFFAVAVQLIVGPVFIDANVLPTAKLLTRSTLASMTRLTLASMFACLQTASPTERTGHAKQQTRSQDWRRVSKRTTNLMTIVVTLKFYLRVAFFLQQKEKKRCRMHWSFYRLFQPSMSALSPNSNVVWKTRYELNCETARVVREIETTQPKH